MNTSVTDLKYHYNRASAICLNIIVKRARAILRAHPHLDEFIMGMGTCNFTLKSKNTAPELWERKYTTSLNNFINEWDPYLHITGSPMRFTAKGKLRRSW